MKLLERLESGIRMSAGVVQPLFGVVAAGRPVMTEFQTLDETKAVTWLQDPTSVAELTFFLLPTTPVPPGHGAILYYAAPPSFDSWVMLGAISPEKPSGVFRTGWPTNESLVGCPCVQLGVALESLATLQNLCVDRSGVDDRFAFAHKIAQDLFTFMASFSTNSQPGMMLVPTTVFDAWLQRFERKSHLDPNFFLRAGP